ncbi:hypothetical protein [Tardiphaga sp.]|uniref:hypothetical protein n=1 Tax=Tardiphaga sp. TaxID=1926292 RepID=UPI00261E6264|nr:hypothetical protein [Tardiphaga sp.]
MDIVTEILAAWREADPKTKAEVLDYLRRAASDDPELREQGLAALQAAVAAIGPVQEASS